MNRITKLLVLICILPATGFSQSFRISYEPGYGLYSMSDLKSQQQIMIKNYPIPIMSVEEFPGYFNHSVSVDYFLDSNILFGINASYLTTGGRNFSGDYSGEYKLDMILNAYQYGIESEYIFFPNNNINLFFNFKLGIISSTLNIDESLILYDINSQHYNRTLTQSNFFMEPNTGLSFNITKKLLARATIGFNIDTSAMSGKLIDWTGFRTRIGTCYQF